MIKNLAEIYPHTATFKPETIIPYQTQNKYEMTISVIP